MIQSSIITASAGSGKTYTVTTELLRLFLSNNVQPKSVLVTTFTKKAAQEIFTRLLSRMITAIEEDTALETLKAELRLPSLTKEQIKQSLWNIIRDQNNLKIQTIDSFFVALGQIFSLELEIPFEWKITEPWEDETVKLESLKTTINSLGLDKLSLILPLLFRDNQSTSIFTAILKELGNLSEESLLISDKSWKFKFEPYQLIKQGNLTKEINIPECKSQLDNLLETKVIGKQMHKGLMTYYTQYEDNDLEDLLASKICQNIFSGDFKYNRQPIPEDLQAELKNIMFSSANKLAESLNNQSLGLGAIFSQFLNQKFEINKSQGLLSFKDLTALLAGNVQNQNLTELYYRLDSKLDFVFIDEFQDTSAMQWMILKPLIEEIVLDTGGTRALVAVGDSKQAIYGWRGGLRDIFSLIKNQFSGLEEKPLSSSYRSSPLIIDFVNSLFTDPILTPEFAQIRDVWSKNFYKHDSKANLNSGSVNIFSIKHSKEKSASEYEILNLIKDRIIRERETSDTSTIGILTNTNKQALLIESYLRSFDIPLSTISSNQLSSFYETQLIISCLTLALHPGDRLSYCHLKGLTALSNFINGKNIDSISLHFRNEIYRHGLGGFISSIFKTITSNTQLNKNIIDQILYLSTGVERKSGIDILGMIRILNTSSLNNEGSNLISILTIYKSKGLEFDHVIIPFTSDLFFNEKKLGFLKDQPDPFAPPVSVVKSCKKDARRYFPELAKMLEQTKMTRISEALCLSYVAITRAKEHLSIFIQSKEKSNIETELSLRSLLVNTLNLEMSHEETKVIYSREQQSSKPSVNTLPFAPEASLKPISQTSASYLKKTDLPKYYLAKNLGVTSPSKTTKKDTTSFLELLSLEDTSDKELGIEIHSILSLLNKAFENPKVLSDYYLQIINGGDFSQEARGLVSNLINSPLGIKIFVINQEAELHSKIRTEYPVKQILGNKLVSGRVDRLIINLNKTNVAERIDLVDFKLGELEKESYAQQLEIYKDLLSKQFKIAKAKISAKLISISKLIEIDV